MTEFSDNFREAVNAQETGEEILFLVTIEHPDLLAPIRINNAVRNIISRGETFLACYLTAAVIDQDPDRSPQAQLTVSNIDRTMVVALRSTAVAPVITLEIIRASEPDFVEMSMANLELKNINYDELVIQGDLIPRRLRAKKAIDHYFSPTVAPGLF
jgi:hypothetical protein